MFSAELESQRIMLKCVLYAYHWIHCVFQMFLPLKMPQRMNSQVLKSSVEALDRMTADNKNIYT